MKTKVLIAMSMVMICLACNKNKKNEVTLDSRNFADEIEQVQNLSFVFSQEMIPETEIGKWDSTVYLGFTPEVKGRFQWVSKNELVFSPATGFDASTDYTVTFNKALVEHAENKQLFLGEELGKALKFHTPYLQLEQMNAFWAKKEGSSEVVIKAALQFNYPVDPKALGSLLAISLDDKPATFSLETSSAGNMIYLQINSGDRGQNEVLVKTVINKGLRLASGNYTSTQPMELSQVLASRYEMQIISIDSRVEDNTGIITVITSQELAGNNLSESYSLQPALSTEPVLLPNGFEIRGNFVVGENYTLTLNTSLQGSIGGKLKESYSKVITFGELPPNISFLNKKAIYLSSAGDKNIGIQITNVPKVRVKIFKIYENNIIAYLRSFGGYYYDEYGDGDFYGNNSIDYPEDYSGMYSDVIMDKEIETSSLPKVNGVRALHLSFPEEKKEYKGIYVIHVSSEDRYYLRATKLVSVSDVGLIAKKMKNEVMVMAHSIKTTEALANVEVRLISKNNQTVYTKKTGSDGTVIFKDLEKVAPGFEIAMVTARQGEDFNYLPFQSTFVETSRYETEGKYDHASGFDAFIYSARNIYRPGEKVVFNTIIRKQSWESVGEVPVKCKLVLPNGKEYQSARKTTNKQGAVESVYELPAAAVTGFYNYEVYNGNDVLLASYSFNVEEFMPDRIKVNALLNKPYYANGDTIRLEATALNLFGPPAADRNYEVNFSISRKSFYSKKYPEYSFYIDDKTTFNQELRQGTTDSRGMATERFFVNRNYSDMGILEASLHTTVFDESGRPVNRINKVDIYTQKVFYGIKMAEYYVGTNQPMSIGFIGLNKDEAPVTAKAKVDIYRYEWQSVVENNYGSYRYGSKKIEKLMNSRIVTLGTNGHILQYSPPVSGEYEVRITREGSSRYVASGFYAYGWGNTTNASFEVNTEGQVTMEFDKPKYEVGDKAKVLFKTPFAGKLIVTLERDKVFEHRVIETDKKSAEIEFTVKGDYLPNVFVSATLIRAMDNSTLPLTVAHGYAPLLVEKKETVLPLEIIAAEKSRSKTKQKITVKTKALSDIEVTIAVVDEGILQLKNFQTPDPHGYYYQKRALEVASYDVYPFLFPELSGKSSTGGDAMNEAFNLEKRVNPLGNTRVKLVSYWSGILKTNGRGEATYEVDIPQFSGDLRIMAVAYKDKAFGSASKNIQVADPLVVSTSLPRFLTPSDVLTLPVNVTNTTNKPARATVTVSLNGPLQLNGTATQVIDVPANQEGRTQFALQVKPQMGQGKVTVSVKGLNETFTDVTDITVRPSTSLLKLSGSGTITAGNAQSLDLANDFIPSSVESRLLISRSPMVQFVKQFNYLLGYPHGCVEQTVAKAFPQIYFADFVKTAQDKPYTKTGENELNPNYNVQEAIRKLSTMQLYNGSLSYWPGGNEESWWGTVFASHFLLEARKAGFEVNESVLSKCLDYLSYRTAGKSTETYYYYEGNVLKSQQYASRETIYSLYVMALGGKPNRSLMNHYKSSQAILTIDARYLLAAAFAQVGDQKSYAALLPASYSDVKSIQSTGGSFYSSLRNLAISLNALVENDPGNRQIPAMTKNLSEQLRGQQYINTQEAVFSFLALGKLARINNKGTGTALVKANGSIIGRMDGKDLKISGKDIRGKQLSIETSGSGSLYYFWETEGLSATGKYTEEDSYLRVRRTYFDRFGHVLTSNRFKQNDLIVVRLAVSTLNATRMDNVVTTDMLPAGFEIENPRITESLQYDWIKNRSYPQHFDIRDDRIHFFNAEGPSEQYYYYVVRAVSKGTFGLGPASSDAMYNGEFHSYHGGGTVVIE